MLRGELLMSRPQGETLGRLDKAARSLGVAVKLHELRSFGTPPPPLIRLLEAVSSVTSVGALNQTYLQYSVVTWQHKPDEGWSRQATS